MISISIGIRQISMLAIWLAALAFLLPSCFGPSPLELERGALRHAEKALDHANRLIPLLEVSSWEQAFLRAGKLRAELGLTQEELDQALKKWALRGKSPLRWELDALEILEEVQGRLDYIQEKLSQDEITTSTQKRLIEISKENAKDLERVVEKIGKAIEKRLQPQEE